MAGGTTWFGVALLTAPLVMIVTLLALSLTSPTLLPGIFMSDDKASLLLVSLAVGLSAGLFEELGWTGFAIPTLRQPHGVLATGLIVGIWWSAWHLLPNVWASRAAAGELATSAYLTATAIGVFVGYLTAFRVLMVWLCSKRKCEARSIFVIPIAPLTTRRRLSSHHRKKVPMVVWIPAALFALASAELAHAHAADDTSAAADAAIAAVGSPADIVVFRPSTGTWFILHSTTNFTTGDGYYWGVDGDIPVSGDYDGDGRMDLTVFRPSEGLWYILNSSTNFATADVYQWGLPGDTPMPGDFDGDGRADITVCRWPDTWFILKSSTNYTASEVHGFRCTDAGDQPVSGDYDGDGRADITVFRSWTGTWVILKSSTNYTAAEVHTWGQTGDQAFSGDYDGDGRADITVFRPLEGLWYLLKSSTNFATADVYQWGVYGDIPVSGDYDGDGRIDLTVYRPSEGQWYILKSSTNFATADVYQWGLDDDIPVRQ